ncbi:uncharacterized protein LOC134176950 isoform X1 [Corticium candelabrum]|uniref:uncharacterized protein LOC134176950 isoform X1 n=1 Tax=Corticium candelabrum TaxID=121492 RepID=UPI002E2557CA|nr:uncharacterized protein LOC134176950 isoform X1 [Corticium candelabrum]
MSNNSQIEDQITVSLRLPSKLQPQLWKRPSFWIWLILGVPLLLLAHALMFIFSWFLVIFIPVAKINLILVRSVLFADPLRIRIRNQSLEMERLNSLEHVSLMAVAAELEEEGALPLPPPNLMINN